MHRPPTDPIGLQLVGIAQGIEWALDDALSQEGGSLSMWRVLVSGKGQHPGGHPDGSEAGGAPGGTWPQEIGRMETAGLVVSSDYRQSSGARAVELTESGEALFHLLLRAVVAFDRRLRTGLTDQEIASFTTTLSRLKGNLTDGETD